MKRDFTLGLLVKKQSKTKKQNQPPKRLLYNKCEISKCVAVSDKLQQLH